MALLNTPVEVDLVPDVERGVRFWLILVVGKFSVVKNRGRG
jgi:hypothetical protein